MPIFVGFRWMGYTVMLLDLADDLIICHRNKYTWYFCRHRAVKLQLSSKTLAWPLHCTALVPTAGEKCRCCKCACKLQHLHVYMYVYTRYMMTTNCQWEVCSTPPASVTTTPRECQKTTTPPLTNSSWPSHASGQRFPVIGVDGDPVRTPHNCVYPGAKHSTIRHNISTIVKRQMHRPRCPEVWTQFWPKAGQCCRSLWAAYGRTRVGYFKLLCSTSARIFIILNNITKNITCKIHCSIMFISVH